MGEAAACVRGKNKRFICREGLPGFQDLALTDVPVIFFQIRYRGRVAGVEKRYVDLFPPHTHTSVGNKNGLLSLAASNTCDEM